MLHIPTYTERHTHKCTHCLVTQTLTYKEHTTRTIMHNSTHCHHKLMYIHSHTILYTNSHTENKFTQKQLTITVFSYDLNKLDHILRCHLFGNCDFCVNVLVVRMCV